MYSMHTHKVHYAHNAHPNTPLPQSPIGSIIPPSHDLPQLSTCLIQHLQVLEQIINTCMFGFYVFVYMFVCLFVCSCVCVSVYVCVCVYIYEYKCVHM